VAEAGLAPVRGDLGALALALAFAGGIASILSPTSRMWWIGQLALIPLVLLVVIRTERFGERSKGVDGGSDDGPWWSP
jgi:hypothetical protein